MHFHLHCLDKPGHLQVRMDNRPAHIDYLKANIGSIVMAGPLLDDEDKPKGSVLILDLPDMAAAHAFAAGDPYAQAGLFGSVTITPFKKTIPAD